MEKFTLKIELGNDAMCRAGDVARSLRKLADKIRDLDLASSSVAGGSIMDDNGNKVGRWDLD